MVEGARLESVCRGNSTEGSNPSLSANFLRFAQSVKVLDVFGARDAPRGASAGTSPVDHAIPQFRCLERTGRMAYCK